MNQRQGRRTRLAYAIATVAGLGDRLPAPGTTAGSFPAAVVWWGVCAAVPVHRIQLALTTMIAVAAAVCGVWASAAEASRRDGRDPGPVVIDEVAGQWLCCATGLVLLAPDGPYELAIFAAAAFFLFRLFDVLKPWPVNRLEHLAGGLGIVADDLAAGILSGAVLVLLWRWLMPGS
jgi:phosphatidylglycerophosphatase A